MRAPLTPAEVAAARPPGWEVVDGKLATSLSFASFLDAMEFVCRVADVAEELDHHPDIDIRWRTVRLAVSTHDAGAITGMDLELARRVAALEAGA